MILNIDTPEVFIPLLEPARYKGIWGGRGCVHPDTLIDTPTGQIKIADFNGGDVYAFNGESVVVATASKPLQYSEEQLYLVTFKDGRSISVTDQHRFLTQRGWVQCKHLSKCDAVVSERLQVISAHSRSTQDISLSESRANALHCFGKREDYQDDCSLHSRLYGQPLQFLANTYRAFFQLLSDERQHIPHVLRRVGDLVFWNTNNLSLLLSHPSNQHDLLAEEGKNCEEMGSHTSEKFFERPLAFSLLPRLFRERIFHQQPCHESSAAPADFDTNHSQDGSQQKETDNVLCVYFDSSFYNGCNDDRLIMNQVESICKHDRLKYWDLHVYEYENYLSNGLVNHNSGKSHFFADNWLDENVRLKLDCVCLRETLKSLEFSVKKLLESKIERYNAGDYFEIQDRRILSKIGGVTIFEGMQNHTADSIKSLEGFDRSWFEEAQNASDKSLTLLRPTIRKEGSELWFSWNPNKETDPIDQLLRGEKQPKSAVVIKANYMDNPWFPKELQDELEWDRARDPGKFAHVWLGEYQTNSEARVFINWTIEEFERPTGTIFRMGADWGFSVDPSVLIRCSIEGRRLYIDYEAYMVGCEIDQLPDLFDRVPESRKWFITADSARPETVSYMRNHGYPKINSAIKGAGSIEEGIEFLKSYDIVIHPRCKHLIDEMTLYSYKIDKLTSQILPVLEDKNNHVIDALRYALEGMRKAVIPKDRQAVVKRRVTQGWMR
jgi:phage terminase large subunit